METYGRGTGGVGRHAPNMSELAGVQLTPRSRSASGTYLDAKERSS